MGHSGLCPEIAEAYTAAEGAKHQKAYIQQLSLQVYSPPLACMRSNGRFGLNPNRSLDFVMVCVFMPAGSVSRY